MNTNLFNHVNINKERTFVPNGLEPDSESMCSIQRNHPQRRRDHLLGLETTATSDSTSRAQRTKRTCVDLTESTIQANKRFFEKVEDVPTQAYTMGIKNIMQAKKFC